MNDLLKHNPAIEAQVQQVAEIAQYLWEKGWAERNAGNISVNITGLLVNDRTDDSHKNQRIVLKKPYTELAGNYFLITSTGSRMRDLAHSPYENAVIVRVADDGASFLIIPMSKNGSTELHPTSELSTHLGIHRLIAGRGSKEKVIIHTHATELIALTQNPDLNNSQIINKLLWGMHPETIFFIPKGIGFVPYALPGSEEIALETIQKLREHDIVVWEKHGVFAIGENISETFDSIDILCKSARIYFLCKGAGFVPEGLTDAQLEELKEIAGKSGSAEIASEVRTTNENGG